MRGQQEADYNERMASSSSSVRTPHGVCAMCFGRKPLTHGWAWLKLCAECAAIRGGSTPLTTGDASRADPGIDDASAPARAAKPDDAA